MVHFASVRPQDLVPEQRPQDLVPEQRRSDSPGCDRPSPGRSPQVAVSQRPATRQARAHQGWSGTRLWGFCPVGRPRSAVLQPPQVPEHRLSGEPQ